MAIVGGNSFLAYWGTGLKWVRRVRSWFKEDVFQRLFVNSARLLGANVIAGVLYFLVTAFSARALGPARFGQLALIVTYQRTIFGLMTFNAWQAIIKFGSERLHANDLKGLAQLFKLGFCLDLGCSLVGTIIAIALSGIVLNVLGWNKELRPELIIYSTLIIFSVNGTPIGILRLFDRFDLLSYTPIVSTATKLVGVCFCILGAKGLRGFVVAYLIAGIASQLYQIGASLYVLARNGVVRYFRPLLRWQACRFPGLWHYLWTTNINASLGLLSREADELVIGRSVGAEGLGLFKICKHIAAILPQLLDPLYQAIYPELARLWAARKKLEFRRLLIRVTLLLGAGSVVGWFLFLFLGRAFLKLIAGPEYAGSYIPALVYLVGVCIAVSTNAFSPSVLAIGLPITLFHAQLLSCLAYYGSLLLLLEWFGITGASMSYIVYYVIWTAIISHALVPVCRNKVNVKS